MNTKVATEGIVVLNFFDKVNITHEGVIGWRIIIYIDNKIVLKNIIQTKIKPNWYVFNCGAICSRIEEIFRKLKVKLIVKYSGRKPKINEEYKYNRGAYLIKIYDKKLKETWKKSHEFGLMCNIKYFQNYTIKY